MTRRSYAAWIGGAVAFAAACYAPRILDGQFVCGPGGLCPSGFSCGDDGLCERMPGTLVDASVPSDDDLSTSVDLALPVDGAQPLCTPHAIAFSVSTAASLPAMAGPALLGIADFDGDQKLDFVISAYKTSQLDVVLGHGDATFATPVPYTVGGATPPDAEAVTVGDFNGDGRPDVVVTNPTSNALTLLKNTGGGAFVALTPATPTGAAPQAVIAGDLNGDGKLDVAVGLGDRTMDVHLGNGDGTFGAATPFATPLAVLGDFNGDGKLDAAGAAFSALDMAQGHTAQAVLGNGAGSFTLPGSMSTVGTSPAGMTTADFNKDGRLDLAVVNFNSNDVTILLGNGNGTFTAAPTLTAGTGPNGVAADDFDCDGNLDLVVTNGGPSSTTVSVFAGAGDGTFAAGVMVDVGLGPGFPLIGDFDGDHAPDVLVVRHSYDVVVLMHNTP